VIFWVALLYNTVALYSDPASPLETVLGSFRSVKAGAFSSGSFLATRSLPSKFGSAISPEKAASDLKIKDLREFSELTVRWMVNFNVRE